ncbi:hypothetical protein [aff. Roholtiella sp. LEGE 12411]|uniref:hypothetical protein n=1 Tax=aff. Roholtiella sp. LEGE 12411 TaxID=1828822 RepID=UPI00187E3505|nr:hypothetical protein [aff. Roholtiella sp. LEGE 12411]MBE9037625.1 hypothetical protein [aff. Roholtiella sp. LEGE 12411]
MMKTQNEIIKQGYDALINSLGVADTIGFIQYFSPGEGDYTKERHRWGKPRSFNASLYKSPNFNYGDSPVACCPLRVPF